MVLVWGFFRALRFGILGFQAFTMLKVYLGIRSLVFFRVGIRM